MEVPPVLLRMDKQGFLDLTSLNSFCSRLVEELSSNLLIKTEVDVAPATQQLVDGIELLRQQYKAAKERALSAEHGLKRKNQELIQSQELVKELEQQEISQDDDEVTNSSIVPTTVPSPSSFHLPQLAKFDGTGNWQEFCLSFQLRYGTLNDQMKLILMKEHLTKQALAAFTTIVHDNYEQPFDTVVYSMETKLSINKEADHILHAVKFVQLMNFQLKKSVASSIHFLDQLLQTVCPVQVDIPTLKFFMLLNICKNVKFNKEPTKIVLDMYKKKGFTIYDGISALIAELLQHYKFSKGTPKKPGQRNKDFNRSYKQVSNSKKPSNIVNVMSALAASSSHESLNSNNYFCSLFGTKCTVSIPICNLNTTCLLDTGANISILSYSFGKKLLSRRLIKIHSSSPSIRINDAQNRSLPLMGYTSLDILGNKVDCFVASIEVSHVDLVIGTNALSRSPPLRQYLQKLLAPDTLYHCNSLMTTTDFMNNLLHKFNSVFSKNEDDIGRTHLIKHRINIGNITPIRSKKRPAPLALKTQFKALLDKMLHLRIIRKSRSEWSSPTVLIPKKDGTLRFCIDFRRINEHIKLDSYPLPNIELTLHSLHDKKVFSCIDCTKGYWQVELEESSKPITAFSTDWGLFEFEVLPFGMATSPAEFERLVESLFPDLIGSSVFVYIDDILIATTTESEHRRILTLVLERLQQAKLKINPKKCKFLVDSINFLGFTLSGRGIAIETEKITKCLDFQGPTDITSLQSFLGFINFFRHFIHQHSSFTVPLYKVVASKKFSWEHEQDHAFTTLKNAIKNAPLLMQPDIQAAANGSNPFCLYVDASYNGVGSVLMQKENDMLRPILFFSRALKKCERRYHISDLEALALVTSLKRYRGIIYGTQVKVFTDHQPLLYLFSKQNLHDRLLRWSLQIQDYHLQIIHLPGKANVLADWLSRCSPGTHDKEPTHLDDVDEDDDDFQLIALETSDPFSKEIISRAQHKDSILRQVIMWVDNNSFPSSSKNKKLNKYIKMKHQLSIDQIGLLWLNKNRPIIPRRLFDIMIKVIHEPLHKSFVDCYRHINNKYYAPGFTTALKKYIERCDICVKTCRKKKKFSQWPICTRPLERVHMDLAFVEHYDSWMAVIVDCYTKFIFARWIRKQDSYNIINTLKEFISIKNSPAHIVTDNQKCFKDRRFVDFLHKNNTRLTYAIPYEHFTNGVAERAIRSVKEALVKFSDKSKTVGLEMCISKLNTRMSQNEAYTIQEHFLSSRYDSVPLTPPQPHTKTLMNTPGLFLRRPDLHSTQWEPCTITARINSRVFELTDEYGKTHRRTNNAVKQCFTRGV